MCQGLLYQQHRACFANYIAYLVTSQERLKQQREEARMNPEYSSTFKGQLSKEEKKAKRKQILANIGETPPTKSQSPAK